MAQTSVSAAATPAARFSARRLSTAIAIVLVLYFLVAYIILPAAWKAYVHHHTAIDETPGITLTGDGHPGDPLNIALIGSQDDLLRIMKAAGWFRAEALGLKSDVKIAADTVLARSYDTAPVSNLFLYGRKEDFAFEQPVGNDPRKRHHVRFWKSPQVDAEGCPAWMGSATYDERVGVSHTTGQITHHISGDVDAERDHIFATLEKTGELTDVEYIDGFHKVLKGVNGGGDTWHSDGRLLSGVILSE